MVMCPNCMLKISKIWEEDNAYECGYCGKIGYLDKIYEEIDRVMKERSRIGR